MKTDNELIAEFMNHDVPKSYLNGSERNKTYETSWDWLMPVVEKISEFRLLYPDQCDLVCNCKIVIGQKHLYEKVVEFIKWYNENEKA